MNVTKIQLSPEELSLVQNAGWVLTKNRIIEKVYQLFGEIAVDLEGAGADYNLPGNVKAIRPKISRGENYKGLPYVMLDYPRFFTKEDVMAIRIFFWWGKYFSTTMHLKGKYQKIYGPLLWKNRFMLDQHPYIAISAGNEWDHDLEGGYFESLEGISANGFEKFAGGAFLKIAAKINLADWNEAPLFLRNTSHLLLQCMQD